MINHLKGTVTAIDQGTITLDYAGIGFGIAVPRPELYTPGTTAQLMTYVHWNQETGPQLFGFGSEMERQAFLLILSCSGIGPKIAISILQQMAPQEFVTAVSLADAKQLSSLKGIGPKKADSIILQLQDKVKKMVELFPAQPDSALSNIKNISDVLQSLSYSRQEIMHTIDFLKKDATFSHASFDELMRKSLVFLAKTKIAI